MVSWPNAYQHLLNPNPLEVLAHHLQGVLVAYQTLFTKTQKEKNRPMAYKTLLHNPLEGVDQLMAY